MAAFRPGMDGGIRRSLLKPRAGGRYAGPQPQAGLSQVTHQASIEAVKRPDATKGFTVLPKHWIVERTVA